MKQWFVTNPRIRAWIQARSIGVQLPQLSILLLGLVNERTKGINDWTKYYYAQHLETSLRHTEVIWISRCLCPGVMSSSYHRLNAAQGLIRRRWEPRLRATKAYALNFTFAICAWSKILTIQSIFISIKYQSVDKKKKCTIKVQIIHNIIMDSTHFHLTKKYSFLINKPTKKVFQHFSNTFRYDFHFS